MRYRKNIEKIKYIEVTEERYYHVETKFKYMSYRGNEKHYHLAGNRLRLQNELEEKIRHWENLI